MGIIYKIDKRRTVPRWRSYEKTRALGELAIVNSSTTNYNLDLKPDALLSEKASWLQNRTLVHGGNLLSAAFVINRHNEFNDVAQFILDNDTDINSPLRKLAAKIVRSEDQLCQESDVHLKDINQLPRLLSNDIKRLRSYLKREPKNAIAWIELGRLYSILGKQEKSFRAVSTALHINKDNRFITRSASRYFHHFGQDNERALHIIKQSQYSKVDPWLISADIVYSSMLDRNSRLIKIGSEYLERNFGDFFSVTELASSLGTVEAINGSEKKAKQYFRQSLIQPNDNSLAQISWMIHQSEPIQEILNNSDIPCAFEVKAQLAYYNSNFHEAFNHAYSWISDEPFSTRPVRLASYIAGVFLNKLNISILLLKFGLSINPNSRELLNDLIYFLIQNGETEEAITLYNSKAHILLHDSGEDPRLVYTATSGLINYKQGNIQLGEELYLKALKQAQDANNYYLLAIGLANYIEQEIEVSSDNLKIKNLVARLKEITKNQDSPDVIIFKNRVLEKAKNLKKVID